MRSSPSPCAFARASRIGRTPKFSAFGPMTRTSGARIPSFIRARSFSACDVYLVNPICCANYTPTPTFSQEELVWGYTPPVPIRQEKSGRRALFSIELGLRVAAERLQITERQEQRVFHRIEQPQYECVLSHHIPCDGTPRDVVCREGLWDAQIAVGDERPGSDRRGRSPCVEGGRIARVRIESNVHSGADINGIADWVEKLLDEVDGGSGR